MSNLPNQEISGKFLYITPTQDVVYNKMIAQTTAPFYRIAENIRSQIDM